MSQPSSLSPTGNVPTQKQQFSVYTMLLIVAALALTVGSVLLALEWGSYGFVTQPAAAPAASATP